MPVTPGASPTEVNLNATVPAAPAGETNVSWQAGSPYPDPNFPEKFVRDTSAYMPNLVGDSGSGGTSGAVPAPAAGDAAAGKFLKADGTWQVAAIPAEIQEESFVYAADTGAANAYAVTLSPAPTLVAGSLVVVKIANANTGASTLAVNGGAATSIVKESSGSLVALTGGELNAGQIVFFVYDGTHFQILSGSGGGGGSSPLTTKGDLYTYSTANARLPVGADKTVLMADSSQTDGIGWKTARGNSFVPQLADSTTAPTTGDLASFDANGNVNDSGILGSSVPTKTGIQNQSYVYVVDSGAANAYVVAPSPAVTSYVAGLRLSVKIANTNTGASTINVSSLGTKNIKIYKNGALADPAAGDLAANDVVDLTYDGTQFQVDGSISQQPYDVWFAPNVVMGSGTIYRLGPFTRTVTFPANFAGSQGHASVAPATTQTITVNKNGSSVGTITITSGGVFTFATTGGAAVTYNAGDWISYTNQAGADPSMLVEITLAGTR